jgi:hypothetical protein
MRTQCSASAVALVLSLCACHREHGTGAAAAAGAAARRTIGASIPLPSDGDARLVTGGKGSASVHYQPGAHVFERDVALRSLAAVSGDGWTLLFDHATPELRALSPGDVLVIKGLLARKVLAVEHDGDSVAVLTGAARLGEVLRDGQIRFEAPVRFTHEVAAVPTSRRTLADALLELGVGTAHAQDVGKEAVDLYKKIKKYGSKTVSTVTDDWDAVYSAVPGDGRIDLSVQLTREHAGFRGLITGKGYVADFDLAADIGVERGLLDRLDVTFRRVNGLMNFNWEVGMDTPGGYAKQTKIKFPGAVSIPLYQMLDGFPLFLEISSAMIIQPVITGGQEYSHGAFRITYDGAQHFRAHSGNIDPDGKVTGSIAVLDDRNISALAPVGMVINLAAPRIELTMNPLRMLGEVQGGSLQKTLQAGAKQVDAIAQRLLEQVGNTSLADRIPPELATIGLGKVADAMRSDAAAFLQVISSAAATHSGSSVIAPCTHTDVGIQVSVGASAQAFGQEVGSVSKKIFEQKLTRVNPPNIRLCNY